jgi:hypothetical protein
VLLSEDPPHLFSQVALVDLGSGDLRVLARAGTGMVFFLRASLLALQAADIHETSWFSVPCNAHSRSL